MFIVLSDINLDKKLIELFIIYGERRILASWMPQKYPKRARIEKIVKGKALDKHQFLALAASIPSVLGVQLKGASKEDLLDMIGHTFEVEDIDLDKSLVAD